jgi:hypothetical protein
MGQKTPVIDGIYIYIWEYIGYTSVYTRELFQEISLSISAKSLTFGR